MSDGIDFGHPLFVQEPEPRPVDDDLICDTCRHPNWMHAPNGYCHHTNWAARSPFARKTEPRCGCEQFRHEPP